MANYFDQFDGAAPPRGGNFFDQFDESREANPGTPARAYGVTDVIKDLGVSFGAGANSLLGNAGTLYGVATGDMGNWAREQGESGRKYWEEKKSDSLRIDEAERRAKIDAADGQLAKGATAFWETLKNPALLASFTAEQIPMFLPIGLVGRAGATASAATGVAEKVAGVASKASAGIESTGLAARMAQKGLSGLATAEGAAGAIGTGAAIAAGAGLQGADVAGDTYDEILKLPQALWESNPEYQALSAKIGDAEAKKAVALDLSRQSGAEGGAASVLTNLLPWARSFERATAGAPAKLTGNFVARGAKAMAGEMMQEGSEEGLGRVAVNRAVSQVDPSRPLSQGVGEAAGLGAIGTGPIGFVSGVASEDASKTDLVADAPADAGDVLGTPAGEVPGAPEQAPTAPPPTEAEKALYTPKPITALDRVAEIDAELKNESTPEDKANALFEERDSITASWPSAIPGAPTSFTTEAGARLDGQYALIEAGDLTTSHDEALRPVQTYPAELQPRERERHASEMQIQQIVGRLDPARLGESADVATGAPIVGTDGLVESGNARTIALKRIYQANGQKALDYKAYIKANADRFGIAPESVDALQKPVLVRVRATPVNRAEFARQANQATVARMSPSEQARSDAAQIDSLDDLNPNEAGDFTSGSSSPFVRRFMAKLPATEQAGLVDSAGQLSQAGYQRIRNAVLAKAYGDSPVLQRMVESLDSNIRNVGAALMRVAPQVAKTREAIHEGALHDADLTPDLMAAVEELSALKDKGTSVTEALAQAGMFGDKLTPESRDLLAFMDANIRSTKRIADFIQSYLDALQAAGNPAQGSMFGDTAAPAKVDLIAAARRIAHGEEPTATGGAAAGNTADAQAGGRQPANPQGDQAGARSNETTSDEWLTFPPDTGTLGIPRAEMPQIKGEQRGALIQFLQGRGINHETVDTPANQLKPSQAEFSMKKVEGWANRRDDSERSVLASSDGYILDGHHQWVAALAAGETEKVIRFDVPMQELLAAAREFPSVKKSEGAPQKGKTEVRRELIEQQWNEALGELGVILRDFARAARIVPEDTPNLMPTLVKLFEAGFSKVGMKTQDLMRYVKDELKKLPEFKTVWHKITAATYRKAAEQALANHQAAPQGDLFAPRVEQAMQGDLFAQPAEKAGAGKAAMVADSKAAQQKAEEPKLSRGSGRGMALRDLQAVADRVAKGFKNLPRVHVLSSPDDLSTKDPAQKALRDFIKKSGAWEDAEGATHEGEIYLFASGMADEARAEHVLATHEITHYGLRGTMGKDIDSALQHVLLMNAKVRKAAVQMKEVRGLKANIDAVEEVLADMPTADLAKLRGWRKLVQAIRDGLSRLGAKALAAKLDAWMKAGLSDQEKADLFVADLVGAAREWVRTGKGGNAGVAATGGTKLAKIGDGNTARSTGFDKSSGTVVADFKNDNPLKAHADYKAAKGGDVAAAARLVQALVKPASLETAKAFGDDVIYVPVHAEEASGRNKIPSMLAHLYSDRAGGSVELGIVQANRAYHTGANAMERLLARAEFAGKVEPGRRYVLVDDVTTMGSTLADLASYIRSQGGEVAGSVVLVNAMRGGMMIPVSKTILELEARHGDEISKLFGIEPGALTASEAQYLLGFRTTDELRARVAKAGRERSERLRAKGLPEGQDSPGGVTRLSLAVPPAPTSTPAQRAEDILNQKAAGTRRPLDAMLRVPTQALRIDRLTAAAYDKAAGILDRITPEQVKAGMVSDYGIPEAVIDRRALMEGRQRQRLRGVGTLLEKLATLTRAESRVAYEWMNNDDPQAADHFGQQLPEESVKVLKEVRDLIDKLSQEAIRLGQLSQEAYERNKFAYLRRSYVKHTAELTGGEAGSRARAIAILGDQYKGRGMTDAVDMSKFKNIAPEWWNRKLTAGQADKQLKGEKFIRLERRAASGEGTTALQGFGEKGKGRLLEVAYWPAGEPIPAKFSTWDRAGTWEVRDTKGEKLVVWRDFTKQEREAMGEIDEARYAIAKTLHGMIHDVEAGNYLEWLGQKYAKKDGDAIDGALVEASERMRDTFKPGEWVQVPDTQIPGTQVKKYGTLAGRYLPGPIWNDVRQMGGRFKPFGDTYAALHRAWKVSKTALSPTVHMNNVMANFVMADWHDVTAGHILKALKLMTSKDAASADVLARFGDSGGTIGTWATKELQQEQLRPLLEALEKELGVAGNISGQVGVMSALQLALKGRLPSAWDAIKPSKPGQATVRAARAMIDLYEAEDQVFRLAAWLRAKEEGASDLQAGKAARKSFLDYSINAPWVQMMRQTAFPFIAFTYRSVPMLLETAARKPWKLMKLGLVAGAINALGYMLSGGDEDDERKLLPEEKAGRIWGLTPKLIRMPWNDDNAAPVFLDVRRWIPVGDIFDTGQTHSALPVLPMMQPGGPLMLLAEFALDKTQFTGKGITLETDTPLEKATKTAGWLYKAFAPNIAVLPGTYAWTGIANAGGGKTDSFGREQSLTQAIVSSLGIKVGSYPKDVLEENVYLKEDAQIMEIKRGISRLEREYDRNGITKKELDAKLKVQDDKIDAIYDDTDLKLGKKSAR